MDGPIFDDRCGLPDLPTIVGRRLVPRCKIPDPPRPIREAGAQLLALAPPTASGAPGRPGPPGPPGPHSCIWKGLVTGGVGNLWSVLLYPRGPRCVPDRPAVEVTILGIPPTSTDPAPAGTWIGPIHGFDESSPDCSLNGSRGSLGGHPSSLASLNAGRYDGCYATSYYHALPPSAKVAYTPADGIPHRLLAPGPLVPGWRVCVVYDFDGTTTTGGRDCRVNNMATGDVAGNAWIQVKQVDGCYFADWEDCPGG